MRRFTPGFSAAPALWAACCSMPCSTRPTRRVSRSSQVATAPDWSPGAHRRCPAVCLALRAAAPPGRVPGPGGAGGPAAHHYWGGGGRHLAQAANAAVQAGGQRLGPRGLAAELRGRERPHHAHHGRALPRGAHRARHFGEPGGDGPPGGSHRHPLLGPRQAGALLSESDEGRDHEVSVDRVQEVLRRQLVDERRLPPFVYLASCHGNEPAGPERDEPASASAAVQLHLAGLPGVVGYFGPIVDELSTRVEDALYDAIAEGLPTPDAVRRARHAFAQPLHASDHRHRPGGTRSAAAEFMGEQIPSAWPGHSSCSTARPGMAPVAAEPAGKAPGCLGLEPQLRGLRQPEDSERRIHRPP